MLLICIWLHRRATNWRKSILWKIRKQKLNPTNWRTRAVSSSALRQAMSAPSTLKLAKPNVSAFGTCPKDGSCRVVPTERVVSRLVSVPTIRMCVDGSAPISTTLGTRIVIYWSTDATASKVRSCVPDGSFCNGDVLSPKEGISSDCTENHKHMHINYYGECKEIEECKQDILDDFPRRMREWLDNIIRFGGTFGVFSAPAIINACLLTVANDSRMEQPTWLTSGSMPSSGNSVT